MATPVKHDANADIFRGQLFLFVKGQPIAFAKSASMNRTVSEVDISNKMTGDWEATLPGKKGYTVSTEAMISDAEGQMSFKTLEAMWHASETFEFVMGQAKITEQTNQGGKFEIDTTKDHRKGILMITSLDDTSTAGEIATFSASFKGVGAYEIIDGIPEVGG